MFSALTLLVGWGTGVVICVEHGADLEIFSGFNTPNWSIFDRVQKIKKWMSFGTQSICLLPKPGDSSNYLSTPDTTINDNVNLCILENSR